MLSGIVSTRVRHLGGQPCRLGRHCPSETQHRPRQIGTPSRDPALPPSPRSRSPQKRLRVETANDREDTARLGAAAEIHPGWQDLEEKLRRADEARVELERRSKQDLETVTSQLLQERHRAEAAESSLKQQQEERSAIDHQQAVLAESHKSVVDALSEQLKDCRIETRDAAVAENTRVLQAEHRASSADASLAASQQRYTELQARHDELAKALKEAQEKRTGDAEKHGLDVALVIQAMEHGAKP